MLSKIKEWIENHSRTNECNHNFVDAVPRSELRVGGQVPLVCTKCGKRQLTTSRRDR